MIELEIIGYIGMNAKTEQINGNDVINFSVAHTTKIKQQGKDPIENTIWVSCSYWGKSKVSEWLTKGTLVCVKGTPTFKGYLSNTNEVGVHVNLTVNKIELIKTAKQDENE